MHKSIILSAIAVLLTVLSSQAQIAFGVSTGIGFNSSYFGYQVSPKIVPYVGFQFINSKFDYVEKGTEFDYNLNIMTDYVDTEEFKGGIFLPNVGVKYFVIQKEQIKGYINANVSKPLLSAKYKDNGVEDEDIKEGISKLSFLGGEVSVGAEYFFSDQFSLGGEFGVRYIHVKFEDSWDREVYNAGTGIYETHEINIDSKFSANPTYSKIALNYYF